MFSKYSEPVSAYTKLRPIMNTAEENTAVRMYFTAASWLS